MIISISQSNYIPWKGYFDLIAKSDVFVVYDDMQYTKRDWRNRNEIKIPNGKQWLSIPVQVKGKYFQKINETKVLDHKWAEKHFNTIKHNYSKALNWNIFNKLIKDLYVEAANLEFLSQINVLFINAICKVLEIDTKIIDSREFEIKGSKTEALLSILTKFEGEKTYLSGSAAKNYLDIPLLKKFGIELEWMNYSNYSEYNQLFPPFEHHVSILDLLLNYDEEPLKNVFKF